MKTCPLLILLLFPILLIAEPFTIKRLGMEQGLSNSYIVGITQDREGYMWFATESGLNRFDGQNFRVYRKNVTHFTSINSNELNKVLADRDENIIWIATPVLRSLPITITNIKNRSKPFGEWLLPSSS